MPLFGRPTAGALAGGGGGSGTVTSVALTVPAELAVAGSPITTAGTLAVTRNTQAANLVMAGPATGAAATPGYRALVAADLPAGTGTVTSVGLSFVGLGWLNVAGSPVTGSGSFTVTRVSQSANLFLASPSGSAGNVGMRAIAAADLPSATAGALGAVQLASDFGGTAAAPQVAALQGVALSGTPSAGQVLTATGATAATWQTPSAGGLTNPLAAGSLAAAALQVVNAGTGLSQQATNTLSLAANAAEFLRGIGVASPTDYLTATASATGGGAAGPVLGVGGSDATIDLLFNTKGASSRYVWQINGATKMDFTDVGGGVFALRNMSGELRTNAGKLNDNFVAWNSDCGLARVAAKVVSASDGSQNANGWLADAGRRRVSAQFDVASNATPANVPGLSVNVLAGRSYAFEAMCFLTAGVVGGSKWAIGGTCTATGIIYDIVLTDETSNAITITSRQTALGGASGQAGTTSGICWISGLITVNAAGTLTVQFSQNSSNGTNSSVLVGSNFLVFDAT
jgi:hypothetical protein